MNTWEPLPVDDKITEDFHQAPLLNPAYELRTIPAGWDVSEMLSPAWYPANIPEPTSHEDLSTHL